MGNWPNDFGSRVSAYGMAPEPASPRDPSFDAPFRVEHQVPPTQQPEPESEAKALDPIVDGLVSLLPDLRKVVARTGRTLTQDEAAAMVWLEGVAFGRRMR